MLDTDPSIDDEKTNNWPRIIQYLSKKIDEWPPLFSIEDDGRRREFQYVGLRLDLVEGEYYPFSDLKRCLIKADIAAEIVGIDTTDENDLPRLILEIDLRKSDVDFYAIDCYRYYEPRYKSEKPMHKAIYEGHAYYFEENDDGSLQLVQHTDTDGELVVDPQAINEQDIADDIVAILKENGVESPIYF